MNEPTHKVIPRRVERSYDQGRLPSPASRLPRDPSPASRFPGARQRAFTLIEVLVAVTLLGLIMVFAYQGLRTGTHTAAQGEAAIERVNRLRLSQEFLRGQLSRALPMAFDQDDTIGPVIFEGDQEVMRFVAPMPGYLSSGGPYIQTLLLTRADGGGKQLVFDHQVLRYGEEAEDASEIMEDRDPVMLLSGIKDAEFTYLQAGETEDEEPEWVDEWRKVGSLPLLISVRLEMQEDARIHWPELVVAPRVEAGGRRGFGLDFGPNSVDFGPRPPEDSER